MDLYLSGQYEYYTPYHSHTRIILPRDVGKEIMCVRVLPLPNRDISRIGKKYIVQQVITNPLTIKARNLESKEEEYIYDYNTGEWVVTDEVKDVQPNPNIHYLHIVDLKAIESGRIATQEDKVQSERKFIDILRGNPGEKHCTHCKRQNCKLVCHICKAYYCGVQCQKQDWKKHKLTCSPPKPDNSHPVSEDRISLVEGLPEPIFAPSTNFLTISEGSSIMTLMGPDGQLHHM